ncbi:unnamed protein product [Linum tenue]|uniref:F-box domain-containing protein n=1 Tax=Linum tenue TaxID=586396 RepID=A0AAV0P1W7_9ROSI|nr:unnamed protein product [Linum tenue]
MTDNCSLEPLPLPFNAGKRRPICPEQNLPPHLNRLSKLGDDLLVEILIRLPNPRSSCRCKAVCKPWRSLISDPSFNRRFIFHHQSRHQPAASLFLSARDPESILSFLPVPDKARPGFRVMDCFKDLLLCGFLEHDRTELRRSYLVCNPFTKQWIALPLAPERSDPGYGESYAALVCLSRSNYSLVQQLGEESKPLAIYSEYVFRVVRNLQVCGSTVLHVFCSESRKWSQIRFDDSTISTTTNAVSCNGELFWLTFEFSSFREILFACNPFHLDRPLQPMIVSPALSSAMGRGGATLAVSQGALHIVVFEVEGLRHGSRDALSVWRLEEDDEHWTGHYWRPLYEMVLRPLGLCVLFTCCVLCLHPEQPEIVFLTFTDPFDGRIYSCNLRTGTGELELFSSVAPFRYEPDWIALQPTVSCWPTPIPRYDELQGMYDGSYRCWVQNSTATTLSSTTGNYFQFTFFSS